MIQHPHRNIRSRVVVLMSFALLTFASVAAEGSEGSGIAWRTDLARAHAEARARDRPLWIQFTGPWCQFCKLMDREALVDPQVIARSRDGFIPVKLQPEGHQALVSAIGLAGLPATAIVSPDGQLIAKHEGYLDPRSFLAFLDATPRHQPLARPEQEVVRAPRPVPPAPGRRPEEGVALAGYCPVSLVQDHKLVAGQDAVSVIHDGRLYRFANDRVRVAFERQPELYVPVNGGRCPVSQVDRGDVVRGNPRYGVLFRDHLYLCADEPSRTRFLDNPDRYTHVDLAERNLCPHCWTRALLADRAPLRDLVLRRESRRSSAPDQVLEASVDRGETRRR
jgi:hypothetical protein